LPVEFFGHQAWTLKSPILLARKTGAAILPVFIRRQNSCHIVKIHPEVEVPSTASEEEVKKVLKTINGYLEEYILENPTEWLWIHRRWKQR